MKAIFCILIFTLSTIISPYQCYLIQIPVVSIILFESVLPVRDGSFSQSLTVEIVGNGYPITMKAIFSILLLVLSAVFYPYQWYLIQVPVISVVSI